MPNTNENELINRLKRNDNTAWAEFIDLHYSGVSQFCSRFVRDRSDAQDISNKVFITAMNRIHKFDSIKFNSLKPWLWQIASAMVPKCEGKISAKPSENDIIPLLVKFNRLLWFTCDPNYERLCLFQFKKFLSPISIIEVDLDGEVSDFLWEFLRALNLIPPNVALVESDLEHILIEAFENQNQYCSSNNALVRNKSQNSNDLFNICLVLKNQRANRPKLTSVMSSIRLASVFTENIARILVVDPIPKPHHMDKESYGHKYIDVDGKKFKKYDFNKSSKNHRIENKSSSPSECKNIFMEVSSSPCKDKYEYLFQFLDIIDEEFSEVIYLHYMDGLTRKEIAEFLCVPEYVVRLRLRNGLNILRKLLPENLFR